MTAAATTPPLPRLASCAWEAACWKEIKGLWKPLHGNFADAGFSIEWHDFTLERDLPWGRSFHPGSLEICLNFSGSGHFDEGGHSAAFGANEVALYVTPETPSQATREAGGLHRFLTIELSRRFLATHLATSEEDLKPGVRAFLSEKETTRRYVETFPLPPSLLATRTQLIDPPVPEPARGVWYLGRVLEVLAETVFVQPKGGELFCRRQQRVNQERVDRVRFLLERDLENPPSLEMLAKETNCSPFYLSRIFTERAGVSIPKFIRIKRIDRAAELIRTGQANVTEAAMAVGYSSLSSFNKAFVERMGCCPGLYPNGPIAGRKRGA